jgi:peptidylprolyl isomerase
MRPSHRSWSVACASVALALLLGACGSSGGSGASGGTSGASTGPSTSSAPAVASAAGKPCVAVADPLPTGAPEVPVKVGPPPTKLVVEDITPGTGAAVTAGSTVTVDYIGVSCSTGKTFSLSGVIPGWSQGLVGMSVGGKRLLGIPPDLGYGAQGAPPDIAPGETLWFVVELKSVQ